MTKSKLSTVREKVLYLMERVPAVKTDYKRLLILYWYVFDGIEIPKELMDKIIESGTKPESVSRAKRKNTEMLFTSADLELQISKFLEIVK